MNRHPRRCPLQSLWWDWQLYQDPLQLPHAQANTLAAQEGAPLPGWPHTGNQGKGRSSFLQKCPQDLALWHQLPSATSLQSKCKLLSPLCSVPWSYCWLDLNRDLGLGEWEVRVTAYLCSTSPSRASLVTQVHAASCHAIVAPPRFRTMQLYGDRHWFPTLALNGMLPPSSGD